MTKELPIPALSSTLGLTAADLLLLPLDLQPLARLFLTETQPLTLEQVAARLQQDPALTLTGLRTLIDSQLVESSTVNGVICYQKVSGQRRSSQIAEQLFQALAPGSPLAVIRNPSGEQQVVAGEEFLLSVTVNNQGQRNALVDVYLEDGTPPYEWCHDPSDRLALAPPPQRRFGEAHSRSEAIASGTSGEVLFHFQVPASATPQLYTYTLVIDSREHYPEVTPLYYQQSVRVLPPVREVQKTKDPTFLVQPVTRSSQPGQVPLEVKVTVHNISNRVDRFRLTCPDISPEWYTIRYPEALETPGVVLEANGLALNPGAKGEIFLILHPPATTPAGIYSPTLRLQSANNPNLALLDLVYLEVPPLYDLVLELRTLRGAVRERAGHYEVCLQNRGNTERTIHLLAVGGEDNPTCDYRLAATDLLLPPYQSEVVPLQVQPLKWWQRPLFGKSKAIHFYVEATDPQALPIVNPRLPGVLLWRARSWWQVLLLLVLAALLLGTAGYLLWRYFPRPPAPPRILTLEAADLTYKEAEGEAIRLNWSVRNPKALQELRLSSSAEETATASKPIVYDLRQGIPEALHPFCGKELRSVLMCKGVPTAARRAGKYAFELAIVPKDAEGEPSDVKKTASIEIVAPPAQVPVITEFKIDNQEARPKYLIPINPNQPVRQVILSWKVTGGQDLKVELLPAPGSVKPEGAIAYRVTQRLGAETYTLKATNAAGQSVTRSVVIETFDPAAPSPTPSPIVLPTLPAGVPGSAGAPLPPVPIPGAAPLPLAAPGTGQAGAPASSPVTPRPSTSPAPSPNPNAPAPTDPGRLSPSELPPQFN